jgi:hypothetical protein
MLAGGPGGAQEVLVTMEPVFKKRPELLPVMKRLVEPERMIIFRVPWVDDKGQVQVSIPRPCPPPPRSFCPPLCARARARVCVCVCARVRACACACVRSKQAY